MLNEILLEVLSFLDRYSLDHLPLVCGVWNDAVLSQTSLRWLDSRQFENTIKPGLDRRYSIKLVTNVSIGRGSLKGNSDHSLFFDSEREWIDAFASLAASSYIGVLTIRDENLDGAFFDQLVRIGRTIRVHTLEFYCSTAVCAQLVHSALLSFESIASFATSPAACALMTNAFLRDLNATSTSRMAVQLSSDGLDGDSFYDDGILGFLLERPQPHRKEMGLWPVQVSENFFTRMFEAIMANEHTQEFFLLLYLKGVRNLSVVEGWPWVRHVVPPAADKEAIPVGVRVVKQLSVPTVHQMHLRFTHM